jgi:crotonobetainyl-CoA:carnitine CoA-transferase CaiB-like acyl-CoA transferase
MVSITHFGQTGPYKDFKSSDIVGWALGGEMAPFGDIDRPPTRISHHSQAYLHAGTDAAAGAAMALYYRQLTGEGQQVDISIQDSVAELPLTAWWDLRKLVHIRGSGGATVNKNLRIPRMWTCKD